MAPVRSRSFEHLIRNTHPFRIGMRRQLARLERVDPEEIVRWQERRLRLLVRVAAARSPFYREYFRQSGVDPRSIRTLADLAQLPLLTRSHLAQRPEDFRTYPRRMVWPASSSGTSGAPITAYRTPGSSVFELCALERQWGWFGLPPRSRRVILRGAEFAGPSGPPTMAVPGAGQLLVSSFHLIPGNVDEIVDRIRTFEPDAVEGWPSSIALLADLLTARGQTLPVRAVITSSETMTPGRVELIEKAFAAPVVDHYGQTERVMMAGSCEFGGYHIFPDYGIVEMLPIDNSETRWELVGTPLHNWGFPLLRYRTGDEVRPMPNVECPCKRPFPLIERVDGRVEDNFTAADGRPIPLPSLIVDQLVGAREAQVAQLGQGRFEVRVAPGPGFDVAACERAVRANIDHVFGPGQEVSFVTMANLPRSRSGKLKSAVVEGVGTGVRRHA